MGAKWKWVPQETKTVIERALSQNWEQMSPRDLSSFLKACSALEYKWFLNKEIMKPVFEVSKRIFNETNPLVEDNRQKFLPSYIKELEETGLAWEKVPKDMKQTIFEGIERRSSSVPGSHGRDLGKLFAGY
jgi:hypothetical protein